MVPLIIILCLKFFISFSQTEFCTSSCVGGDCSFSSTSGHEIYSELTIDSSEHSNTILSSFNLVLTVHVSATWDSLWVITMEHDNTLKYPIVNYTMDVLSPYAWLVGLYVQANGPIELIFIFSEDDDAVDDADDCDIEFEFGEPVVCKMKPQNNNISPSMTDYFQNNNAATNAYYKFSFINSEVDTDDSGTLAEVASWCITDLDTTSVSPTLEPTNMPTVDPTSASPTQTPSFEPSLAPILAPSLEPTVMQSIESTLDPSVMPSENPSEQASSDPSSAPSSSVMPSEATSKFPSFDITTPSPSMTWTFDMSSTTIEPSDKNESDSWFSGSNRYIIIIVAGAILLICCVLCLICCCQRRKKGGHSFLPSSFEDEDDEEEMNVIPKDEDNPLLI